MIVKKYLSKSQKMASAKVFCVVTTCTNKTVTMNRCSCCKASNNYSDVKTMSADSAGFQEQYYIGMCHMHQNHVSSVGSVVRSGGFRNWVKEKKKEEICTASRGRCLFLNLFVQDRDLLLLRFKKV